ncbi:2-phospho-L-lactate transferase [Methyloligella sp. 2.7D]|uniref:2-phospho-L-lactate transferase n=1 Tax=unclassified Methyloligella TaxID=2625955 RepID=UPI00157D1951|nr:2-phospho-L-lactate transferase [Methyloligella sp. GL2]QKP76936.1 2-phospho-L-lactate transferase [Methyloligella sp. GL2]
MRDAPHYLALCGGVGGAKLADGLAKTLPEGALRIAVNVGDDFEHLSLHISPDLDTVLYTLGGLANRDQGWGREAESWGVLDELRRLGGDDWFLLGDKDIALHLLRRARLDQGLSLTAVTAELATRLGVKAKILPITDDKLRTVVETDEGPLAFQDYFVRRRCAPAVRAVHFEGAETARLNPQIAQALASPSLAGVILCPSNPYLSIAPMLAVQPLRQSLATLDCPVVAVSPIVAGSALKGPAAKMMREMGHAPSAATIAELYVDFADIVLADEADADLAAQNPRIRTAPTIMHSDKERLALARICLDLVKEKRGT